jgi:hypothetical protein
VREAAAEVLLRRSKRQLPPSGGVQPDHSTVPDHNQVERTDASHLCFSHKGCVVWCNSFA